MSLCSLAGSTNNANVTSLIPSESIAPQAALDAEM